MDSIIKTLSMTAEQQADKDRFMELQITSNFLYWTPEEATFFVRYCVENEGCFPFYGLKIEADIINYAHDENLVNKAYEFIGLRANGMHPSELISLWQHIEYFSTMTLSLQKYLWDIMKKQTMEELV
jgi:hypothetical protein